MPKESKEQRASREMKERLAKSKRPARSDYSDEDSISPVKPRKGASVASDLENHPVIVAFKKSAEELNDALFNRHDKDNEEKDQINQEVACNELTHLELTNDELTVIKLTEKESANIKPTHNKLTQEKLAMNEPTYSKLADVEPTRTEMAKSELSVKRPTENDTVHSELEHDQSGRRSAVEIRQELLKKYGYKEAKLVELYCFLYQHSLTTGSNTVYFKRSDLFIEMSAVSNGTITRWIEKGKSLSLFKVRTVQILNKTTGEKPGTYFTLLLF